jgi:hypothetical protein
MVLNRVNGKCQMIKITEEDSKRIQEIIGGMQCPKNLKCAEDGFKDLCRARDFGDENLLQCLEETSPPCPFAGVYDYGYQMRFCRCPLRVYLAKNLAK